MKKYRFKTREEFELIGRWIDEYECPEGWAEGGEMNEYLGQEIVNSDCVALCESNDEFRMDGWSFSNHDYVVMEEPEKIDRNLLIDCSSEAESHKVFSYLESLGEKTNRTSFSFSTTRAVGNWYFIAYYSVQKAWTVAREGNDNFGNKVISAKEFLNTPQPRSLVGRWVKLLSNFSSDQPIGSYDLIIEDDEKRSCINLEKYRMCARERLTDGDLELMPEGWIPDNIFDKNANVFPTNWCLKITDDNEYTLDAWRKRQPDFYKLVKTFQHWLISDKGDGTYTNWSGNVPSGYTEITFEQFKENVLCSSLFLDSKDVINKGWQDGLKGTLYNPPTNYMQSLDNVISTNTSGLSEYRIGIDPFLTEDVIAFIKKHNKPLIENVQSINVNLRTKKKNNKLIF